MQKVCDILDTNPEIGVSSSLMATIFTLIESMEPILKFIGIGVGIGIGIVTFYIKMIQAVRETRDLKRDKKNDEAR